MSFGGQTPTIIVLKEGTDSSQGKGQIISNINACLAVQATIRSTLGPYGGDLLLVDANGRQTITNDGATVMKLLDIVHPAARILTDIARSQDAEVGDGTTSVVVLAGEILKEIKEHVEQGVSSQTIIKGLRRASAMAVNKVKEIAVNTSEGNKRETLSKLAGTAMSSKLIKRNTGFFTKSRFPVFFALLQMLILDDLNEKLIGVKKIPGGSLTDSLFVNGVAFKKTFSYAGFEQQPKTFKNPKIVCLNVELELKSEKDNAEVRVEQVSEYQAIVDAEWQIIYNKMEALYKTGAKVVLSKLPIGDLATQYFADRDIFCAGRVAGDDLERIIQATGGSIQSTCSDIHPEHLGTCGSFDERQIGGERFNFFEDCPAAKTCTLVLRGGAEQFIAEVERSLHDAIMIVKRAIKNNTIVAGGGACEMEVSAYLHRYADGNVPHKQQAIIKSFAKALEVIPRQLCDNAGFDATDILNRLRVEHRRGNAWSGVDFDNEGVRDNLEAFVWEPALVKINAIQAATEASCLILSVDETIKNEESAAPMAPQRGLPPGAAQRAIRGRGRGMPRR
ncbi:putative T-complex protein 1 subunit eta [Lachnellula suecica]|uniref:T-complex protein 1 subunit eta n=1 Tax=Lachnellula suecica TaxID=602035 RepID=A0A8T9C244_9HELO|nr:putative T-complex protein 1 subunit eta [Lachnellula suecica]